MILSWSVVWKDVSQSLSKPLIVGLDLIFTFNVGTLIITLSFVEVDFPTRFSVKIHFFTPFEEKKWNDYKIVF